MRRWLVADWDDTTWGNLRVGGLRGGPAGSWVSVGNELSIQSFYLHEQTGYDLLLWTDVTPAAIAEPETIRATTGSDYGKAGARSHRRRWAASIHQPIVGPLRWELKTAYSDTARIWHEVPALGDTTGGPTIAPLGDTTAVVVYGDASIQGLRWRILDGALWGAGGVVDAPAGGARFRRRPSGGYWLGWHGGDFNIRLGHFDGVVWSVPVVLLTVHEDDRSYDHGGVLLSNDHRERPTLTWFAFDTGFMRNVGCIAFPTDGGWTAGEEIPGTEDLWETPSIARDRNGDAWVSWQIFRETGVYVKHTYVTATCTAPSFAGSGAKPRLAWTLSEPAPESRWTVLRAEAGGAFEAVATVEAGSSTALSFSDTTAPEGVPLRYRIRRECLDTRYQWTSEEASWWPRQSPARLRLMAGNPSVGLTRLVIEGAAAGAVRLALYDLHGREVAVRRLEASGAGRDEVALELAPEGVRPGVYFARATDPAGRGSNVVKLVVLR